MIGGVGWAIHRDAINAGEHAADERARKRSASHPKCGRRYRCHCARTAGRPSVLLERVEDCTLLRSCAINSRTGPPRTQPTDMVSLKKMARGFGLIRGAWKLVFEKTSTCDIGT